MKLPFAYQALVSETKLTEYLLSEEHPVGRTKARIFRRFGYDREGWSVLAQDLCNLAREYEVTLEEQTPFGTRFIIDGILRTPSGRPLPIRTIWFVDNQSRIPHLVTAYPR
ncbi:MAG: DUF6883 domain-containing protein [Bacteroidota bacterium]